MFAPKAVAVVGASNEKGSVGYSLMSNLIGNGYDGTIYPVNIKHESIQGIHSYKSVKDIPRQVDLAIIATPAKTVPGIVSECGQAGIKAAVIISAGFREAGEEGQRLEQQVMDAATSHGIRIVGPNCLGVINPRLSLNASFAIGMPKLGNIAFISQSGALCSSIIDWANDIGIGFSYFVSIGSMLDVDYGDLIDYFGRDPKTTSIVIYMESLKSAKKFMSAASGFARQKPIVVVKSGRYEEGRKAVVSHTGAIAGGDDVYSAAFRRAGVVRVAEVGQLFDIAEKLSKGVLPKGPNITVITNAGGPGVMAVDKIIEAGGSLGEPSAELIKRLDSKLPASWSRGNPIDVLGDANAERYRAALEEVLASKESDSIIVIYTPQAGTDPKKTAKAVSDVWSGSEKPITACFMGGKSIEEARRILRQAGIPVYPTPENAVMPLILGYSYNHNLELLHETPKELTEGIEPDSGRLNSIIEDNRGRGIHVLSERESKEFLKEYGINTNPAVLAKTRDEAVAAAEEIGYPVVLKIDSPQITHKTDAKGVMLSLYSREEVEQAFDRIMENAKAYNPKAQLRGAAVMKMVTERGFEMLLGSKRDEVFGQVVVFGAGGTLVEVLRDKSIGLPPLNQSLAHRMMQEIKGYTLLAKGSRDRKPADLKELERAIVGFSQMVIDHPEILEAEINPLLACNDKVIALDARIVIDKDRKAKGYEHLCIKPYPSEYAEEVTLRGGEKLTLRPIKPEDEPSLKELFESLSERTIHYRFFHAISEITHEMLIRYCHNDYDREIAIVAQDAGKLYGVARLMFDPGEGSAEFAVVVTDSWQNKGLGSTLVKKIVDVARKKGLRKVYATVITENTAMKHVAQKLGFKVEASDDPQIDNLTLYLEEEGR